MDSIDYVTLKIMVYKNGCEGTLESTQNTKSSLVSFITILILSKLITIFLATHCELV